MRLTGGVEYKQRKVTTRTKDPHHDNRYETKYSHYYDAIIELDWGYNWGCGGNENDKSYGNIVGCTSYITKCTNFICGTSICSDDEIETAHEAVQECVKSTLYDNTTSYEPYNPNVGPSNDINWPNIIAYGDCDTCTASLTVPPPKRIRSSIFRK